MIPTLRRHIHERLAQLELGTIEAADLSLAIKQPVCPELFAAELWALVAFVRHERRQKWVGYLVESRLTGNCAELAHMGAFSHPEDIPQSGDVPDEPGWKYEFHGRGCCFVHEDGTVIDVDFADDGSAIEIDPYFYAWFLRSAPNPGECERRLIRSEALENAWHLDLQRLSELGFISREHRFRLTDRGREVGEAVERLVDCFEDAGPLIRCWLLILLGDYTAAATEVAEVNGLNLEQLRLLAQEQSIQRAAFVRRFVGASDSQITQCGLKSLAALGAGYAISEVVAALKREPVTGLNHTALAILNEWQFAEFDQLLMDSLRRLTGTSLLQRAWGFFAIGRDVEADRPRMGLVVRLVRSLFERHGPSTMLSDAIPLLRRVLNENYHACADEAAFFLYLLDEAAGLRRLVDCLSSRVPITREGAACFLALIGSEASIDLLLLAAARPPDEGGHEAACALSLLPDARAQEAALRWQRRYDGYEDVGDGIPIEIAGRTVKVWDGKDVTRANVRGGVTSWFGTQTSQFRPILTKWKAP